MPYVSLSEFLVPSSVGSLNQDTGLNELVQGFDTPLAPWARCRPWGSSRARSTSGSGTGVVVCWLRAMGINIAIA